MIQEAESQIEMIEVLDGKYKAGDLLKLVGLTYRQLNDWEERAGVMASDREGAEGWRWFTGAQVMGLAVCMTLRRQFSLPLVTVHEIYQWLLGKWADSEQERTLEAATADLNKMLSDETAFRAKWESTDARNFEAQAQFVKAYFDVEGALCPIRLAYRLASYGLPVYLVRQRKFCGLATEAALVKFISDQTIQAPAIICPLNPIFNEVLKRIGKPALGTGGWTEFVKQSQKALRPDLTAQERKVLALIRARDYQRVTVHVKGGEVIYADSETEEKVQEEQAKRILDVLNSKSYETMTVHVRDGKVIQLGRKSRQKLSAVTG